MHYLLQRYSDNRESTLGLMFIQSQSGLAFQCYTLEDEARSVKLPGETRIPAGIYPLKIRDAVTPMTSRYRNRFPDWFTFHIEIVGVPGFTYVYVHIGNKDDDTDACVLLGDGANNNRTADGFISSSEMSYRRWYTATMAHLKSGGNAFIEIRDEAELINRAV